MDSGILGTVYQPGQVIVRQGEPGDCMYVIQAGQVAVMIEQGGRPPGAAADPRHVRAGSETLLAVLGTGEFFGERAIFERQPHSATMVALDEVHLLTVDKRNLLRQISEDPTLAFHLVQRMSARNRALADEIAWLTRDAEFGRSRDIR